MSLGGSLVYPNTGVAYAPVRIRMTEFQRSKVIAHSGTTGGDGSAILLDTRPAAFFDVGHNPNTERFGIVANETADTTLTVLTGRAIINYSTGFLQFESNETIDSTPSSLIQLENFQLLDIENVILDGFVGSSVTAYDTVNVSLVLTEYQRAYAQIFSGSTGGIGNSLTLKVLDKAFRDVGRTVFWKLKASLSMMTLYRHRLNQSR